MAESKKKINLFGYLVAWIRYTGAFLTRVGNIGDIVRDSFADIQPPKKDEYYI